MRTKKIAKILALVFVIGLIGATIYSRGYAERNKVFVQIGTAEPTSFNISLENVGYIQYADVISQARGYNFVINTIVHEEAFADVGEFMMFGGFPVVVTPERNAFPQLGTIMQRHTINNDVHVTVGFNGLAHNPPQIGDRATITFNWQTHTMNLIPENAVHRDMFTGDYYVYAVTRRDGMWGREFVLHREPITHGVPANIGMYVNLSNIPDHPIVINADGLIYDESIVRIFR